MIIGREYEVVQRRTGFFYRVRVERDLGDGRFVGVTLTDSPQWSAGASIAVFPEDVVTPA